MLLPALPSLTAIAPANGVQNGGFETSLAGWAHIDAGTPLLVGPGASGTAQAVRIDNHRDGNYLQQSIVPVQSAALVLDFQLQTVTSAGRPGCQLMEALSHDNPGAGTGQITISLGICSGGVGFPVFNTGGVFFPYAVSAPGWQRFTAVLDSVTGIGVLSIDGMKVAVVQGDPAQVDPANVLLFGDGGQDPRWGAAQDLVWDEVDFGPALPLPDLPSLPAVLPALPHVPPTVVP
ncbi:MAG: hypothetical protein LC624_09555 [Halobacteriales archaeon]|nr:hypothetical protein [Halobacteriales archaeon]